jgi:hypothetical protein
MTKTPILLSVGALTTVGVLSFANNAAALGPLDLEVGVKAGVGTTPSNIPDGSPNPLGFGIGGRAGISILGLYGGGSIIYYTGGSQNNLSVNTLMYGFEGGYGIKLLDLLTLRAQVGVGSYQISASLQGTSLPSKSNLYLEPGITGIVTLPGLGWFVGADANVLVLTGVDNGSGQSQTDTAFTLHGQVGYKF